MEGGGSTACGRIVGASRERVCGGGQTWRDRVRAERCDRTAEALAMVCVDDRAVSVPWMVCP